MIFFRKAIFGYMNVVKILGNKFDFVCLAFCKEELKINVGEVDENIQLKN